MKNHETADHYDDLEGNVRTFTHRDYSKKTKVYSNSKENFQEILDSYRKNLINLILNLDAKLALPELEHLTVNGEWDDFVITDPSIPLEDLIIFKNLLLNRQEY